MKPHQHALVSLVVASLGLAACRSVPAARAVPLGEPPRTVVERTGTELDAAVDRARVVCFGELHAQRPVQRFARDVLERMAARGGKVLVGMEMFQRPCQAALDDYVAGKIDEREMLRRTEYFTRWKYDHTMYAPIWRFARAHGIRIVALNPDAAIATKIGRQGLGSLTPEERAGVAADIDLGDVIHRARIMGVFEGVHKMPAAMLENYYDAMTTWDETMAESAARALAAAGPHARMLVVAGSGHVEEYTGVPARLAKRVPGLHTVNVICRVSRPEPDGAGPGAAAAQADAQDGEEDGDDRAAIQYGDFLVVLPAEKPGEAPRLGVQFKDASLVVEKLVPGGNAERIGLQPGDELTAMSGPDGKLVALHDLTDLKWVLDEMWAAGGKGGFIQWTRGGAGRVSKSYDLAETPEPAMQVGPVITPPPAGAPATKPATKP